MSTRADLLVELGCEELPARLIMGQLELLAESLGRQLAEAGLIEGQHEAIRLATPRRLAVRFPGVLARQADRELERKGPAEQVALDADGKPTRAAEGFARSLGKSVDQLEWLENEQGRWLFARVIEPGQDLEQLLATMLGQTVREMAGARSMRWSDLDERFLRPVRWLCVLHGDRVLPVSLFGLTAGRVSQGHRIHSDGWQQIERAEDYERVLESARVLADPRQRAERIREQVQILADRCGLRVDDNPELIDENAGLTEWPVAVMGEFDPGFLEVPEEALISSMQQHQKCFPLRQPDGRLAAHFIAIANIESTDPAAMTAGFERVIRPRLSDAQFFWRQDRKRPLKERRERLDQVLFEERLGSTGDKVRRIEILAGQLSTALKADKDTVVQAAGLSKCDLLTEMVGEFPELQGIMGRYYALADGFSEAVAKAIEEHYMPRQAGAALPQSSAGQVLALADRLDTVVGIFAAGKKPKGGRDPFALRRAALGVVRILDDSQTGLDLEDAVRLSVDVLANQASDKLTIDSDLVASVLDFLLERLRSYASDQGIDTATLNAVGAGRLRSVADFMARARAVQRFAEDPRVDSLIAAYKRSGNLLKQASDEDFGDVDDQSLQDVAEKALLGEIQSVEKSLSSALANADYDGALATLSKLREPVDAFFDQVMVMCDEPTLKANRLALLKRLRGLISDIADLGRLGR